MKYECLAVCRNVLHNGVQEELNRGRKRLYRYMSFITIVIVFAVAAADADAAGASLMSLLLHRMLVLMCPITGTPRRRTLCVRVSLYGALRVARPR